jgi:serine protease
VADYQQADIDLYLYDTEDNILDFSTETGEVESLVISRDGTYVVNAHAREGASNYILAVGTPNESASYSGRHYNIIPWQAVVKYKDDSAASSSHREVNRRLGMDQRAGGPGRGRLFANKGLGHNR